MPSRGSDINLNVPEPSADPRSLNIPRTEWYQSLAAAGLRNDDVHGPARYWLQVEGSFTQALRHECRHSFHVEIHHEGFTRPSLEEAHHLNIPARQNAWIREVRLCGDGNPWVLARTIIPLNCLEGEGRRLRHLGNRPLGAYLFSSPRWQRGPIETGLCTTEVTGQPEIARRSLFSNGNRSLLVGEYLLPGLYR